MKPFITTQAIRDFYLYSLAPNRTDYQILFGDKWEKAYNEALKIPIKPNLTGFIKHWREQVKSNYFDIYYKKRNG